MDLYAFVGDVLRPHRLSIPDSDYGFDRPLDARKSTLEDVFSDTGRRTSRYAYDFGGSWDHCAKIESVATDDHSYPILCRWPPPENVHLRIAAGRSATPTASRPSATRITNITRKLSSAWATITIPTLSPTSNSSSPIWRISRRPGPASGAAPAEFRYLRQGWVPSELKLERYFSWANSR